MLSFLCSLLFAADAATISLQVFGCSVLILILPFKFLTCINQVGTGMRDGSVNVVLRFKISN